LNRGTEISKFEINKKNRPLDIHEYRDRFKVTYGECPLGKKISELILPLKDLHSSPDAVSSGPPPLSGDFELLEKGGACIKKIFI